MVCVEVCAIIIKECIMDYNVMYENWLSNPLLCAEGVSELQAIADNETERNTALVQSLLLVLQVCAV